MKLDCERFDTVNPWVTGDSMQAAIDELQTSLLRPQPATAAPLLAERRRLPAAHRRAEGTETRRPRRAAIGATLARLADVHRTPLQVPPVERGHRPLRFL